MKHAQRAHRRHQYPVGLAAALLAAGALWTPARAEAATGCPGVPGATTSAATLAAPRAANANPPFGLAPGTDDAYSDPVVAVNRDKRIEAFALEDDGTVQHAWQLPRNGGWSVWNELGGSVMSGPSAALNEDGRIEVFALSPACRLEYAAQTRVGDGPWSGWSDLGAPPDTNLLHLTAITDAEERTYVFVVGTDHEMYARMRSSPSRPWRDWEWIGRREDAVPAAAVQPDGRLALAEIDVAGHLNVDTQRRNPGPWKSWWTFPSVQVVGDPAIAVDKDGRVEAFAVRKDGVLVHTVQTNHGTDFSALEPLGGDLTGSPTVALNKDGRLEAFALGKDGALEHAWQSTPGSSTWSNWYPLGTVNANAVLRGAVAVARDASGALHVVGLNAAGYPVTDAQKKANGPDWTDWTPLPHAAPLPPVE